MALNVTSLHELGYKRWVARVYQSSLDSLTCARRHVPHRHGLCYSTCRIVRILTAGWVQDDEIQVPLRLRATASEQPMPLRDQFSGGGGGGGGEAPSLRDQYSGDGGGGGGGGEAASLRKQYSGSGGGGDTASRRGGGGAGGPAQPLRQRYAADDTNQSATSVVRVNQCGPTTAMCDGTGCLVVITSTSGAMPRLEGC